MFSCLVKISVMIMKRMEALTSDSKIREEAIFPGHQNEIQHLRRMYAEYHCEFNVRFFPFDRHECFMIIKLRSATTNMAILRSAGVNYEGPRVLTEFLISEMSMKPANSTDGRSKLIISIKFERLYKFHLSQSFFQSWLLGFLSYLTFWIDIRKFNDRFMGSLTALLVLTSLISTLAERLPNTSYFKMIDIWLFFFICSTSINIALHILIDQSYRRQSKGKVTLNVNFTKLTFFFPNVFHFLMISDGQQSNRARIQ